MRKLSHFVPDEDAPLLLSLHRGELSAFETLVWKYQKRVFNLALLLTGSREIAVSVAEISFITAFQKIKSLKSTERFSSWLFSLALNECREQEENQDADLHQDFEDELTNEEDYAAAVHVKLKICIRQLPLELGELIVLRYVRKFSLERINEILQVGEGLLLTRLFEAQETLACWLKNDMENRFAVCGVRPKEVSHPEIRRNFSAYLDNSVEGDEKELTKEHLRSCGSCREALAELEWMIQDISEIPDEEPPHGLTASILDKIRDYPAKPAEVRTSSYLKKQLAAAAILVSVISVIAYLLLNSPDPPAQGPASAAITTQGEKTTEPARSTGIASFVKGVLRGALDSQESRTGLQPVKPGASPPLPPAAEPLPQAPAAARTVTPDPAERTSPVVKRVKPEAPPSLLQEWGDAPVQGRSVQKTAPSLRTGGSDIEIVLAEVTSEGGIESAVRAVGGSVNGRGFSSGVEILYVRVEADRFFDLLGRIGKVGRIQELPRLPDGADGAVDLIIKW